MGGPRSKGFEASKREWDWSNNEENSDDDRRFGRVGSGPAVAADLAARTYTKAPALAAPLYNWTGFYVGAMGGFGKEDTSDFALSGGFGGGTAGYNWQTGQFVFGIEADAAGADISSSFAIPGLVSAEDKIRALGTVRGRLGIAYEQILFYGTGGFAWADERLSATALGVTITDTKTRTGWTAGAGAEWMFLPHWSVKAEYLYRSFGSETIFAGAATTGTLNIHSGQVGVNYHF
jgi:outer membrane immunogenic protein